MKTIDLHSHFSTKRGYVWQTPEEVALAEQSYRYRVVYRSEEEMANDFREANVRAILNPGFTMDMSLEELRPFHDYAGWVIEAHPDALLGCWACIDPRHGSAGVQELERCIGDLGFRGFAMNAAGLGIPPSNEYFTPFYRLCADAQVPVLICVGYTGWGAGLPGGKGLLLEHCHPRYVDEVAARFPDLTIIAARPAWPWQSEMIAVALHKPNVWYELHGWAPKYFTPELKWEISHRLRDKVMFGADYPMFSYERLFREWHELGYDQETLDMVFFGNASRLFAQLGWSG